MFPGQNEGEIFRKYPNLGGVKNGEKPKNYSHLNIHRAIEDQGTGTLYSETRRLEEIPPPNGHPLPLHPSPMIKAGVPILTLLLQSLDNLS